MKVRRLRGAVVRVVAVTGMVLPTIAVGVGLAPNPVQAASPNIVISQVYGGGGNTGATYRNDFIELFNRGTTAVNVAGWSVQYASSAGTTWQKTDLFGTVQPGQYYLVQESGGTSGFTPLPTPDAIGTIPMSAVAGKVALVNTLTLLSGGCPLGATTVDFVGYGSAATCFEGAGPTPGLTNATAAFRAGGGCTDTDNNSTDFAAGLAAPRNFASPMFPCALTELAPTVTSTTPPDGAGGVAVGANLTINFSEAVNVTGAWFDIACTISGSHTAVASGGPTSFTLDPDIDFVNSDSCTATVFAAQVTDQDAIDPPDNMVADFSWTFSVGNSCGLTYTPTYAIQGSGSAAAITGVVTTQGVVVGDYEGPSPTLRGFYLQDLTGDANTATSDGIFVFNGNNNDVSVGDVVRVSGTAGEFQDQTQVSSVTSIQACGTGNVTPVDVTLPFASADFAERYEGMLVRLPQTLTVTEHFQLGRFGQVVMSSGGRLAQPTNVVAPGAPALALQAQNNLNRIIVDDDLQSQNPDPIVFGRGGDPLSATNTLRGGDTATGIVGVMTYTWAGNAASGNAFRVRPVTALGGGVPNFVAANPRPAGPGPVGGTLRVTGMNLLNYFNTFGNNNCTNGVGGAATDCRGADNATEFGRQTPKTVEAIVGTGADIVGIVEIENDGYGPTSAIQDLVSRLNAATAPGTYAFVDVDTASGQVNALGTDAIKVGLVYKPASVTPVGTTAVLNSDAFVNGGDSAPRNRATVAQAFEQVADGARVIVNVNHLKSKGSACTAPDAGDGQGNCNIVRTNAANLLASWLASDPTGTGDGDVLIVGDLNAYAKEDPVTALLGNGYSNLIESLLGAGAYSFAFDGQWGYLDHALASSTLAGQVTGVTEWHINADEPNVIDYNTNFKSPGQISSLYSPDRFRMSDHDPVIVGLDLNAPPSVSAGGPYAVVEGGSVTVSATGSDPNGDTLTYAWDLDDNGSFETAGQNVSFSAASLTAPGTHTIRVRATDPGGLSATSTTTVSIRYPFSGFLPPLKAPPAVNSENAGRVIPVKFGLGGNRGTNILAAGSPTSRPVNCSTLAPIGAATATVSKSELKYEAATDQYKYMWSTEKSWAGTCREFLLNLDDGSQHSFVVAFK